MAGAATGSAITGATNAVTGVADGIFGTGSSTTQNTNTNTNTDSISSMLEQLTQVVNSSSTGTQTGNTTAGISRLDEELSDDVTAIIDDLAGRIEGNMDFSSIREAAVNNAIDAGIGNVIEAGTNVGAYDSSATASAAERLGARAANEGAQAEAAFRLQEQQNVTQTLTGLVNVLKGANETQSTDTSQTNQNDSTQRTDRTATRDSDQSTRAATQSSTTSRTQEDGIIDQLGLRDNDPDPDNLGAVPLRNTGNNFGPRR